MSSSQTPASDAARSVTDDERPNLPDGALADFARMTVAEAQARLSELCRQVSTSNGRVTLAGQTAADHVVLISCEELEAIEEALSHFGDSDHGQQISRELTGLIGRLKEESITPRELIAKARKLARY